LAISKVNRGPAAVHGTSGGTEECRNKEDSRMIITVDHQRCWQPEVSRQL
jgi:hypothetical protein